MPVNQRFIIPVFSSISQVVKEFMLSPCLTPALAKLSHPWQQVLYCREDSIAVLWRCVVFTSLSDLIGLFHPWTSWQVQAFSLWLHAQSFVSVCRQEIPVCMWLLVIITCPSLGCCSVLSVLSMKRTRSVHEPHCDSVPFAYGQFLGRRIPTQVILLHSVCSTVPPNA